MEEIPENNERPLIQYEQSLELARNLLRKYRDEIRAMLIVDNMPEPDREAGKWGKSTTEYFIRKFPEKTLERFEGHGVRRGNVERKLASFINIIQNGAIKGECAKLENSGYYDADIGSDLLVISHIDTPLPVYPTTGTEDERRWPLKNDIGWIANPGAFVVGMILYPIVDELKLMFPNVNIIRANEVGDYFDQEIAQTEKSK